MKIFPYKFTYPFRYIPRPEIVAESVRLISEIESNSDLNSIFQEGKMLGILMVENPGSTNPDKIEFLHAFSGNVGGKNFIDGFVPPVFDLLNPQGYFKNKETEISRINAEIKEIEAETNDSSRIQALKASRKAMSNDLQEWIFRQYMVLNAKGEKKSILDIFRDRNMTPPGGTGDCAAPKLLQYAYLHGLKPLAMGEFWFGKSPVKEVHLHGHFYPSCTGKCGPLLSYMMEGLDVESNPLDRNEPEKEKYSILFEDDSIIVVNKPSGMLSVPGKTMKISLQEKLGYKCGHSVFSCHRLDMDTSGVMVYAKSVEIQADIEMQFNRREISKSYLARLLPGKAIPAKGRIEIPLMLDYYDRPRQMADFDNGKKAITEFELIREYDNGEADIRFTPLTGRTHQLRVHAAHEMGLGRPIKGDRLYGDNSSERLHLHAERLTFRHPETKQELSFTCAPDDIW